MDLILYLLLNLVLQMQHLLKHHLFYLKEFEKFFLMQSHKLSLVKLSGGLVTKAAR